MWPDRPNLARIGVFVLTEFDQMCFRICWVFVCFVVVCKIFFVIQMCVCVADLVCSRIFSWTTRPRNRTGPPPAPGLARDQRSAKASSGHSLEPRPHLNEQTQREREERTKVEAGERKKAKFWASHPSGSHSGLPPFPAGPLSDPSGPDPSGPKLSPRPPTPST